MKRIDCIEDGLELMTGSMARIMARSMASPMAVDTRMLAIRPLAKNKIQQSFAKV